MLTVATAHAKRVVLNFVSTKKSCCVLVSSGETQTNCEFVLKSKWAVGGVSNEDCKYM